MNENRRQDWEIRPKVDRFIFERFTECIADIAEPIRLTNERFLDGQIDAPSLSRAARNISVGIRNLMLDGGGYLFKKCVHPLLHPLEDPKRRHRRGLVPDVLLETHNGMSIDYTVGAPRTHRTFSTPAYTHKTVVNPLYGLRRIGKEKYVLDDLFDFTKEPIKCGRWMNLKVLQVGDAVLSAESILHLLANYEGAHVETNEMVRLNASLPIDVKLPGHKGKDELYRKGTWVTFGGVSYMHIFVLLMGVYLVNRMKETLRRMPDEVGTRLGIHRVSGPIFQAPSRIAPATLLLEKGFNIGVVLQSTGDSFELVGDYEKPGMTTIQIPGWK